GERGLDRLLVVQHAGDPADLGGHPGRGDDELARAAGDVGVHIHHVVRSPSGVPAPATGSVPLATGRLSPVSADSSTSSVAAFVSRPSAGTISPASTATISPGTSRPAGISASWPFRLTLALMMTIFCRAATDAAAFPSCCRPSTALNSVSRISSRPVPSCLSG